MLFQVVTTKTNDRFRTVTAKQGATLVAYATLALFTFGVTTLRADSSQTEETEQEARIRRLIDDLGSEEFAIRTRAQSELERIGVSAFDGLDEAKDHDDIEVALRVRYLLRTLSASWAQDDDPAEVKAVLKAYGEQVDAERRTRMERLAAYNHRAALSALCRLARFETNPPLAKHAALLVMSATPPKDDADRAELVRTIRTISGNSRRVPIAWLKQYALTLENPDSSHDAWTRILEQELREFVALSPRTSSSVTRDLLRWHSDFLRRAGKTEESNRSAERLIEVVDGTPAQLSELVTWFMEREFWSLVQALADQFTQEFERSPVLIYRRAEALARTGKEVDAESLAEKAFQLVADRTGPHAEMAVELRDRGLFKWSEREFRKALELNQTGDTEELQTRYRFSEMLYDLDRPLDAAQVWQVFIDRLDKDGGGRERVTDARQPFRARMHYFYAKHHMAAKNWPEVRKQLDQALLHDPNDADVLIAKHRLPDADAEWKRKTNAQIKASADHFLEYVRMYEVAFDNPQPGVERETLTEYLANQCNQYAWLVGNTNGNVDEAIRLSHRSVELMPKTASYLDTLAHCYFAKKDYANAVKYQSLAARRDPHSLQIKRQLGVFEAALKAAQP